MLLLMMALEMCYNKSEINIIPESISFKSLIEIERDRAIGQYLPVFELSLSTQTCVLSSNRLHNSGSSDIGGPSVDLRLCLGAH